MFFLAVMFTAGCSTIGLNSYPTCSTLVKGGLEKRFVDAQCTYPEVGVLETPNGGLTNIVRATCRNTMQMVLVVRSSDAPAVKDVSEIPGVEYIGQCTDSDMRFKYFYKEIKRKETPI